MGLSLPAHCSPNSRLVDNCIALEAHNEFDRWVIGHAWVETHLRGSRPAGPARVGKRWAVCHLIIRSGRCESR